MIHVGNRKCTTVDKSMDAVAENPDLNYDDCENLFEEKLFTQHTRLTDILVTMRANGNVDHWEWTDFTRLLWSEDSRQTPMMFAGYIVQGINIHARNVQNVHTDDYISYMGGICDVKDSRKAYPHRSWRRESSHWRLSRVL